MSKATHTPGPWQNPDDSDAIVTESDWTVHIATVWNNDKVTTTEETANARLIAAAPDLLAALESFGVLACTPEWDEKRRAAVAKAKGEESGS